MMVNPGGTGRPIRAISARFAPLPPRRFLIDASPSVFAPNRYMNFRLPALGADFAAAFFGAVFLATFFAICFSYFIVVLHMRAETGRYRRESGCTKLAAETGKKSGKLKPDGFRGPRARDCPDLGTHPKRARMRDHRRWR